MSKIYEIRSLQATAFRLLNYTSNPLWVTFKWFVSAVRKIIYGVHFMVWVLVAMTWPLLRWLVSMEVFFQMMRMFYYWDDPQVSAGWTFMLHFGMLTLLTWFAAYGQPKKRSKKNFSR